MFSDKDQSLILELFEELTGATRTGNGRYDNVMANVERRMNALEFDNLVAYLQFVEKNADEMAQLISALTIHTTSWFRENPHFVACQEILLDAVKKEGHVFKIWCAACSTGEEVYSFALLLEEFRRMNPAFEYKILGTDIDALSVAVAQRAIYPKDKMGFHVARYSNHILEGSGKTEKLFTFTREIRDRVSLRIHDLRQSVTQPEGPFDLVVCRNVLIYFPPATVIDVVSNLVPNLAPDGHLMLGHSETVNGAEFNLNQIGHSIYAKKTETEEASPKASGKIKILSVDDSALTRKFLERAFTEMGFESVTLSSASEATNYLNFNNVDLITLDLKMPKVTGDKWLKMERDEGLKTPVVILSDVHASDAKEVVQLLAMGAQEYIEKEKLRTEPAKVKETLKEIIRSTASSSPGQRIGGAFPTQRPSAILIGASTGGPQALVKLLDQMPPNSPPILITQHMSPKFMRPLGERLAEISGLTLSEMNEGEILKAGTLYMPFGDYHIGLAEEKGHLVINKNMGPAFNSHRPSVDYMFNSSLGLSLPLMGILLTGMGRDGALGLRFLRKEGSFCMAQSEEDCVVYGMPKEAIERDAADYVGNIEEIRGMMLNSFSLRGITRRAG